jgi:hypothetical protein
MTAQAVKVALELMHVPSRVRHTRSQPLPEGVSTVLRIAAGEEASLTEATETFGRSPEVLRAAAAFFIEQILLGPGGDSYKILGGNEASSTGELRRNMALLLRWLHPDVDPTGIRSIFAGRVTKAWEDVNTPTRRAAYDQRRLARAGRARARKSHRWSDSQLHVTGSSPGFLQRALYRIFRVARSARPERP